MWVTKLIKSPPDSWFDTKLFKKKLVSDHHIIYQVFEVRTGFIMRSPATIRKLKAAFLDKGFNKVSVIKCLVPIPHGEVFHLNLNKSSIWIMAKLLYYIVDDFANTYMITFGNIIINAKVVLVGSFDPTNIVVRVRYHVNIEFILLVLRPLPTWGRGKACHYCK